MNRFTFLMLLALFASAAGAGPAREPASYFSGPAAAASAAKAATSQMPTLALPPPLPARKGAPTLPPLELPPLAGMEPMTPPVSRLTTMDKKEPSRDLEKGRGKNEPETTDKEKGPSPFFSRSELAQKRKACKLEYSGSTSITALAKGQQLRLKFHNSGEPCIAAAAPDDEWVEAAVNSVANEVLLTVEANTGGDERSTNVNVLAGNQTFTFTVKQPGRTRGCKRATFRKASAAPVPEGFEP